jgi:hypothetical protein
MLEPTNPLPDDFNTNEIAASEYEFPGTTTDYICEPITSIATLCIICGETIFTDSWCAGPKVCDSCKEAVQFIKDKLMEEKDE